MVDCGIGAWFKRELGNVLDTWLEDPAKLDKWEDGTFSARDKRVLLTQWVAEAWERFVTGASKTMPRNAFLKTGCGLAVDGSTDKDVRPEGTSDYNVSKIREAAAALAPLEVEQDVAEEKEAERDNASATDEDVASDGLDSEDSGSDDEDGPATLDEALPGESTLSSRSLRSCARNVEGMEVVGVCPAIEPNLRHRYIVFKWPDHGWCVGQVVKAERKIANDGFNATVKYPGSRHHYRHLLAERDSEGVVRYNPSGDGPDSSWVLLARAQLQPVGGAADANEEDE